MIVSDAKEEKKSNGNREGEGGRKRAEGKIRYSVKYNLFERVLMHNAYKNYYQVCS